VGDEEDVYAVIHYQPDWSAVLAATEGSVLAQQAAAAKEEGGSGQFSAANLLDVRAQAMNVFAQTKKVTKNVSGVAMSAGQSSMKVAMSAGQSSMKVATSATKAGMSATKATC
jgi:hypothetical protein